MGVSNDRRESAQRAEVEFVLESGIFRRAPSLERLFLYLCERSLSGDSGDLKEYTIGVEALLRPGDFDPERDASVRVAAHRVRKRLEKFYNEYGQDRAYWISLPVGQYRPVFTARKLVPAQVPSKRRPWRWGVACLMVLAIVGAVIWSLRSGRGWLRPPSQKTPAASVVPLSGDVRIAVGSPTGFRDRLGNVWLSDRFGNGGTAERLETVDQVAYAIDAALFRYRRVCRECERFEYAIPLQPGTYDLRLHFAEIVGSGRRLAEGARTINIYINKQLTLRGLDVFGQVGTNAALTRVFRGVSPGPDGMLRLLLGHREVFLNGLEVLSAPRAKMRPLRMVASSEPFIDSQGLIWLPDHHVQGGVLVARPEPVTGDEETGLYRSERFGRFSYVIPVGRGKYTLSLRFAEAYFGPGLPNPRTGGVGSRIFDILLGHQVAVRGFDILGETGGIRLKAVERRFHGVEPDANGNLSLSFAAVSNYPCLSALELVEE